MAKIGRPRTAQYQFYVCEICGKEFELASWQRQSGKFCSKACWHKAKVGRPILKLWKSFDKTCETCGQIFRAGGWQNAKRNARYCSRACSSKAHTTNQPPQRLSPTQAAYIAGFFDGEGSLVQARPHVWRFVIHQSEEEVLNWITEVTGTGKVSLRSPIRTSNLIKKPVYKPAFQWQLYGHNAALLIQQLLPYLHVKKVLAEAMLKDYVCDDAQHATA